jgi:ubiquinone/menaquinone biosynthesis C-methylase UbiE
MPDPGEKQFIKPQEVINKCQITAGMTVADLGCGNLGYFVIPIAKLIDKDDKVYAVDIQKAVLEGVKSKAKLEGLTNIETVWSNLEKVGATNIPEASLDVALLINILFQNKNRKDIMTEAVRLLKSGGKLVVVDWKKIGAPFGPEVSLRIDPNEIKTIAQELNLQLVEETDFGEYFWGLIFTKS